MHILQNAIDATHLVPTPQIIITTQNHAVNQSIQICIKDNGVGIAPDIKSRIFDPFFTTKPVGSGKGLGLAISYQIIVDQHGGKIEVTSEPNCGSSFLIKIPLYPYCSPV